MTRTPAQRKADEKYRKSEKGRAAHQRAQRKWEANNPEKVSECKARYRNSAKGKATAERSKLSKYGITPEMYALMYAKQGGVCQLCKKPEKEGRSLAVDHCHASKKVRGLLCFECNTGLGKFKDDPELLRAAARYIKVHNKRASA